MEEVEERMKIKLGGLIYDGKDQPIMVILTQEDKDNIANMAKEATKYCEYPENSWGKEAIRKWMAEVPGTAHVTDEDDQTIELP